jgi:hypothetical protein
MTSGFGRWTEDDGYSYETGEPCRPPGTRTLPAGLKVRSSAR